MKTTFQKTNLLALILMGTTAFAGCSSFVSPSAEYVRPGELCTDVSDLPDPNEPTKPQTTSIQVKASQYGYGGKREESPERLLLQADAYFEQKRFHDSARLYKKYLLSPAVDVATPELLATIHYRIGFVANKKTFYSEAKAEFAQALQLAPVNNEYLFAYAKACYESGDYQTADLQFATLLTRAPGYPEAQRYYGLTLLEGSNRANALQPLLASIGELQAYALLTDKYYEVGELELAAQMESQTIQIAAQTAQPIPRFPHKEQIMASAQNATYAQALHNKIPAVSQTTTTTQTYPTQYASTISPAPAPRYANQADTVATQHPITPPDAAKLEQTATVTQQAPTTTPVAPQLVAVAPSQNQRLGQTPAFEPRHFPVASPEPSMTTAQLEAAPTVPPLDPVAQELAQVEPLANQTTQNSDTIQYLQMSPTPVGPPKTPRMTSEPSVERNDLSTREQSATSEPVFGFAPKETANASDQEDEWDDSAFATSGTSASGTGGSINMESQSPQPELPMPPDQGQVAPDWNPNPQSPRLPAPVTAAPFFSQKEKQSSQAEVPNSFALAVAKANALEAFERLVVQAIESERAHNEQQEARGDKCEFVGYIFTASNKRVEKKDAESRLVEIRSLEEESKKESNATSTTEKERIDMVACELPSVPPQNLIPLDDATVTPEKPKPIATSKKRVAKSSADVGNRNPGLFVATAAVRSVGRESVFRPGSIETTQESDQNVPDEIAVKLATRAKRQSASERAIRKRELEWIRVEKLFERLAENALLINNGALAYYEPIFDAEEEFWDDSAFATSGEPVLQTSPTTQSGFGNYMTPSAETTTSRLQSPAYVAQLVDAPQPVAQTWQSPLQRRQTSTPEERLEAARRAGANVVELSPEQYRHAVATGLGQQPR